MFCVDFGSVYRGLTLRCALHYVRHRQLRPPAAAQEQDFPGRLRMVHGSRVRPATPSMRKNNHSPRS